MGEHLSKLARLPTIQALMGVGASLLGIGWTLSNWGLIEALCSMAVLLLVLACLSALVAGLVVIAWVGRTWGVSNTLRGAAPWVFTVACVSVATAALVSLAATLHRCDLGGTLWTTTCLVVLAAFLGKGGMWVWRYLPRTSRSKC